MAKKENFFKKKKNILIIVGVILLVIILLFLYWFFNRKFNVTFDFNNNTENVTIQVKYKKLINEKDIKTKKELGERFISWYEVTDKKDGEDILSKEAFDFKTLITRDYYLKAVYEEVKDEPKVEAKTEYITIKFNSNGGSKVKSITIEKGTKLSLPKSPSKKGYKFVSWTYKSGSKVKNKTTFKNDTTLYAKWEKLEETISLSTNRTYIHRNGYNKITAKATVKNSSGKVTYSVSSDTCVKINSDTGVITTKSKPSSGDALLKFKRECVNGSIIKVTAKTPSGKTATKNIEYEKDLELTVSDKKFTGNGKVYLRNNLYTVLSNVAIKDWTVTSENLGKYKSKISSTAYSYTGNDGVFELGRGDATIKAKTKGGQSISIILVFYVA